jgi:DNA-binding beta-propeller fold protein YncE
MPQVLNMNKNMVNRFFIIFLILGCLAPPYLFSADMYLIASLNGDKAMGKFNQPSSIFFDESKKRLYIADTGNNRLLSFDNEFNFISEFDAGGELKHPMSVVRNSKEQFLVIGGAERNGLFIIDIPNKIFKQFEIKNAPVRDNPPLPRKLAIDKDDNLYIIDRSNGRILVVNSNGECKKEITVENKPVDFSDIHVDSEGNIYSLSAVDEKIYLFNNKGELISSFGKMSKGPNQFEFPVSLTVSKGGFIYVLDQHKGNVILFNKTGIFQSSFFKSGWNPGDLYNPASIHIDSENRIYITDRGNNRIQIFQGEK